MENLTREVICSSCKRGLADHAANCPAINPLRHEPIKRRIYSMKDGTPLENQQLKKIGEQYPQLASRRERRQMLRRIYQEGRKRGDI